MIPLEEKEDYLFNLVLHDTKEFVCYVRGITDAKEKRKVRDEIIADLGKKLNICKSPIERILCLACLSLPEYIIDEDVIPQYKIGNYIADVVWKPKCGNMVVFEADGHDFHEKTKEQAMHDKERDRYMLSNGIKVYRFTGSEIFNHTLDVLIEVQNILAEEFNNLPEPE